MARHLVYSYVAPYLIYATEGRFEQFHFCTARAREADYCIFVYVQILHEEILRPQMGHMATSPCICQCVVSFVCMVYMRLMRVSVCACVVKFFGRIMMKQ